MSFSIINSNILLNTKVFNVREDHLRLPDGKTSRLFVVDHNDAVTMVPVDQDGMIWFIRQYRHPAGKYLLELPAGVMESGESPEASARREIQEEIGMGARNLNRLGGVYLAPGYSSEFLYIFLASDLYPDPLPSDEDEFITIEKKPVPEALALAENAEIQDAKTLVALFWARPFFIDKGFV